MWFVLVPFFSKCVQMAKLRPISSLFTWYSQHIIAHAYAWFDADGDESIPKISRIIKLTCPYWWWDSEQFSIYGTASGCHSYEPRKQQSVYLPLSLCSWIMQRSPNDNSGCGYDDIKTTTAKGCLSIIFKNSFF